MIKRLRLSQFRIFETVDLTFEPGLVLIVGQNGQGKTSLLEAIYLLSTSQVLRGSKDVEVIRHGQSETKVIATMIENETDLGMEFGVGKRKKGLVNGIGLSRAADLIGRLPCVAFTNEDLAIVRGEPSDRRAYLDTVLCQIFPSYLRHLATYKRSLEQRNALLKQAADRHVAPEEYEPWEAELAEHGAAMRQARLEFLNQLSPVAQKIHEEMSQGELLELASAPKDPNHAAQDLQEALSTTRPRDVQRGTTQIGPHRDDVEFKISGTDARLFGSQGQQRTAAISVKLATLDVLGRMLQAPPVLLLDDVFSELDAGRRERLLETALKHTGQVFLTCTEPGQAGDRITESAQCFWVDEGKVNTHR